MRYLMLLSPDRGRGWVRGLQASAATGLIRLRCGKMRIGSEIRPVRPSPRLSPSGGEERESFLEKLCV